MSKWLVGLILFVSLFGFVGQSDATLVTSLSNPTIVDFSQFNSGWVQGSGPVQVGGLVGQDIVFTSNYEGSVVGNEGYGLGDNGSWNSGRLGYTGLNTSSGYMQFDFNSGLVNSAGGFINYAPYSYGAPYITTLDQYGNILESYTLDISTRGGLNQGAFYAIYRDTADIKTLRLSNAYIVLDDLSFNGGGEVPPTIPEPATMMLLASGLMGAMGLRRKVS